jgi:hypothetical protein
MEDKTSYKPIEKGCDYQNLFILYFCGYALTLLWQNNDADCNIIGGIWGEIYNGYPIWF